MISPELARQIRYIQIGARRAVDSVFGGEYASVFRGQGMEFQEVRDYQPGDEIRSIDWNVTARMGSPYVKRYVEERELTVLFVVDLSASGTFGSTARSKTEVAAELTAVLAFPPSATTTGWDWSRSPTPSSSTSRPRRALPMCCAWSASCCSCSRAARVPTWPRRCASSAACSGGAPPCF